MSPKTQLLWSPWVQVSTGAYGDSDGYLGVYELPLDPDPGSSRFRV